MDQLGVFGRKLIGHGILPHCMVGMGELYHSMHGRRGASRSRLRRYFDVRQLYWGWYPNN